MCFSLFLFFLIGSIHKSPDMPEPTVKAIVRQPAPSFKGQAWHQGKIQDISLEQYKGKYVVLFFYPLDFTFVCPTEIV